MTSQLPQQQQHLHQQQHHHHHNHQQQRRAVDLRIPAIEKYAYCLCLHVKPTTIFIAVFKLIRALLFASILLNSEFTLNDQSAGFDIDDRHRSTAAAVTILTRIVMAVVSAVAIYAVVSGRAALLMPLYAMLLVDFFFALPAFYNRDLDPSLADGLSDFKNYPAGTTQYTRYSLLIFSTITMIVKIYFLCVIWKCYRYLRLIELVSPIRLSEIYPHIHPSGAQYPIVRVLGSTDSTDLSTSHNVAPPPYESIASSMKPPNYEEAMKTSNMVLPVDPAPLSLGQLTQQTVVFTNPSSLEQRQTVSTQVVNNSRSPQTDNSRVLDGEPAPQLVVENSVVVPIGSTTIGNNCDDTVNVESQVTIGSESSSASKQPSLAAVNPPNSNKDSKDNQNNDTSNIP